MSARFDKTYCSQCGGEFGPGDEGFSHCEDHMQSQHTPGEWHVANGADVFGPLGGASASGLAAEELDAWQVADCNVGATFVRGELRELSYAERQANARRIVQCVNAHDALVAALREMVDSHTALYPSAEEGDEAQRKWVHRKSDAMDNARAAIAAATGQKGK